jgi:UDP-N-acetylglucosamine acyltransferase
MTLAAASIADIPSLIHPTAIIHPNAELHPTVQVGPYAILGPRVKVGAGSTIGAHVILDGWTEIGANNQIFPGAAIGLEPQDLKYRGAESLVKIGDNNCIREYVSIHRATDVGEVTSIGNHNLIMAYVHVGHNCTIQDQVIITNSVALAGHVHIENKARIGGAVGVHQFVHIGQQAMIGGMSRINRDVPPYLLIEGNPAAVRSLNLVGLKRSGFAAAEEGKPFKALKQAFRLLYHSGLLLEEALAKVEPLTTYEPVRHLHQFMTQSLTQAGRRGLTPGTQRGIRSGEGRDA